MGPTERIDWRCQILHMQKRLAAIAVLSLVAAVDVAVRQELSVGQIVARHLEARGGAARLHQLQTVVYSRGKYREPGLEGSGKSFMAMARPYYKIVGDPLDSSSTFREGYDGGPRSSSSAFALGRACRSAGKIDEARLEFRRALALDPSNKKASDALATLESSSAP